MGFFWDFIGALPPDYSVYQLQQLNISFKTSAWIFILWMTEEDWADRRHKDEAQVSRSLIVLT